jgi:hypothetical protein
MMPLNGRGERATWSRRKLEMLREEDSIWEEGTSRWLLALYHLDGMMMIKFLWSLKAYLLHWLLLVNDQLALRSSNATAGPPKSLRLHHVLSHTLHGSITGLGAVQTVSSIDDGLSRLMVSYEHAKVRSLPSFLPPFGPVRILSWADLGDYRWLSWNGTIVVDRYKPFPYIHTREHPKS